MRTIFVFIKAALGKTYAVANDLLENVEEVSEIHSVSGRYDLLVRCNLEDPIDIGRFVTERLQTRANVADTQTLIAFKAFHSDKGPL